MDRPGGGDQAQESGTLALLASQPAPKRSATRIRRFKTEVVIVREGNRLVLELPETFDKTLIPEGRYRLEAQMAAIASFKLVERPGDALTAEEDVEAAEAQKELV